LTTKGREHYWEPRGTLAAWAARQGLEKMQADRAGKSRKRVDELPAFDAKT